MRKTLLLFIAVFCTLNAHAAKPKEQAPQPPRKTICLNMIVKDEALVIERCLGSLKHLIDYWVIVDTGSKDGTQEIIKNFLKDIPGELHERPWVDFAHNRNEALDFAKNKGDYLLLIDADEVLHFAPDFSMPPLTKDLYFILVRQLNAVDVKRNGLINNHLDWRWHGVLHEVLQSPQAKTDEVLKGVLNICNSSQGSGRSQNPEKYLKDAKVLEKALKKEPNNSRYAYYLGISYSACDKLDLAKKSFEKRVAMKSDDLHETYMAMYNLGLVNEKLNNLDEALECQFKTYAMRPTRAEPLFRAAILYRKKGNYLLGYLLSKFALTIPRPANDLCVEYITYDYGLLIEFANCALLAGRFQEGYDACCQLLANPNLPADIRTHVLNNRSMAQTHL